MTCEQALVLLSGALDGENTEEEARQLQAHLDVCPSCRALLEAFREIDADVAKLRQEPPENLCASVMEQILQEASPKKKRRLPAWVGVAAAAALTLVLLRPGLTPQPEPTPLARTASEPAMLALQAETPEERTPQSLAEELGADVVVTDRELPELEHCVCETLDDGSVLFCLETPQTAEELSKAYGLPLCRPQQENNTGVSYALLVE